VDLSEWHRHKQTVRKRKSHGGSRKRCGDFGGRNAHLDQCKESILRVRTVRSVVRNHDAMSNAIQLHMHIPDWVQEAWLKQRVPPKYIVSCSLATYLRILSSRPVLLEPCTPYPSLVFSQI